MLGHDLAVESESFGTSSFRANRFTERDCLLLFFAWIHLYVEIWSISFVLLGRFIQLTTGPTEKGQLKVSRNAF